MNEITSFQTLVGTLYKKYNKASVYGKLDLKTLYILNLVNRLLYDCPACNNKINKELTCLAIKLKYSDKEICNYHTDINYYIKDVDIFNNNVLNTTPIKVINTAPTISNPPELDGSIVLAEPGDIYVFTENIFTTNYNDAQGDSPLNVRIEFLPTFGLLSFNGELIEEGFTFNISQSENLMYERIIPNAYEDTIQFQVSDNNINQLYSNMATFTINVNEYINLPPDEIGDNELTTGNRTTIVFTPADFTTNTIPPYEDPEGDGPEKLKVKTLPSQGLLKLNGVNVVVNQEILFTQINSGLLTFVPDDTNAAFTVDFDFDVSDLGSHQFSGL